MKKWLFCLLFLGLSPILRSQTLTGQVLEISPNGDTTAVAMAALQWLNTSVGAYSDLDGHFDIPRTESDTLLVSYATYQSHKLYISPDQDDIIIFLSQSHSLNEVSVVARNGAFISAQPVFTQIITQEGLRRAACCSLAESFESTAAVDMEFSDAVTGARHISMLGLAGIYSQILLENVPFIRLLTQQFGLGFVPGPWMEAISVSKGVASVTNGFEAISGQINIDYKKPETNTERLFLNLYGNSMGKGELNFNTRIKVGQKEKASTMLMLYAGDQFAKMDMNKDGFLDVPRNQQINAMNRWDINVNNIWHNRSMISFVWDNRVGGQKEYDRKKDRFSHDIYGLHISNKKLDIITKNGFMLKGEDESIGTILSYTAHWTDAVFGINLFQAVQHSAYANILYSNRFGKQEQHKLTAGGSMQYDGYGEYLLYGPIDFNVSPARPADHEVIPGIFAEYSFSLQDKFIVMTGMRLDYNCLHNKLYWTPRIHLKWQATPNLTLRASAGKGYRSAHVLAENVALLTSNRHYTTFDSEILRPEEAYNAGISLVQSFNMPGGKASFAVDYFYTHFVNQAIVDMDMDAHSIMVYNLNGPFNGNGNRSRSHSVQAELTLLPFQRFEIMLAYRYNDVRYTTQGTLRPKALMSPHKGLVNLNYSTRYDRWKFNINLQVNGPQRLPDMSANEAANLPEYSPTFCLLNAQITKKFRRWEIYAGGENLLNYKQKNPIIDAENPFGENFDATIIYAPITGIMGYLGVRFVLK